MLLALICAGFAGTIFTVALILFGNRSNVSRVVAQLEDTATPHTHHRTAPIVAHLLSGIDKTAVSAKLQEAGWYKTNVTQFVAARFICAVVVAGIAIFALLALQQITPMYLLFAVLCTGFGFSLPSFTLDDAIKKRKAAIGRRIPDLLDMVSTTVEAGVALNAALATATGSMKGPLADEIEMVLSDIRLGRNRADAFNAMAQRAHQIDLSSFVMAIVQTERLGGNIGHVLDELAEEARSRRLQRAEEIAAALPVKMVVPMAFLMLPALFVMVFTPIVAQLIGINEK
jgi:tight adherence protein C